MIKTLTAAELRRIAGEILENWENHKTSIHLKPKDMYHLVGLKKTLEQHFFQVNDALILMLESHGATPNANGGYVIPPENREEVQKLMNELGAETIDIEYTPIVLREEDHIDVEILDAFYEFIEFQD